jgi:hypothetical protein
MFKLQDTTSNSQNSFFLLTSFILCGAILSEKLIVAKQFKNFPEHYENQMRDILFTPARP